MFGVDKEGNDTLAPQFSHGKSGRSMKPGSNQDLYMRIAIEEKRLFCSKDAQQKALIFALRELYNQKKYSIPQQYLENARNKIIDEKIERRRKQIDIENQNNRLMHKRIGHVITSGMISTIRDREVMTANHIANHEEHKYRQELEKSITIINEDVINSALLDAYNEGVFEDNKEQIDILQKQKIHSVAVDSVHSAIKIEAEAASRNAVLRIERF